MNGDRKQERTIQCLSLHCCQKPFPFLHYFHRKVLWHSSEIVDVVVTWRPGYLRVHQRAEIFSLIREPFAILNQKSHGSFLGCGSHDLLFLHLSPLCLVPSILKPNFDLPTKDNIKMTCQCKGILAVPPHVIRELKVIII